MAIRDWPSDERPREKLLGKGAAALSETLRAGPALASPRATRDFLSSQLRDLEHEVFCCLEARLVRLIEMLDTVLAQSSR